MGNDHSNVLLAHWVTRKDETLSSRTLGHLEFGSAVIALSTDGFVLIDGEIRPINRSRSRCVVISSEGVIGHVFSVWLVSAKHAAQGQ